MEQLIGGWQVSGVGRFQSGYAFNYGNYRLVGMTDRDLQMLFKFYRRKDTSGVERIYMFPQEVIDNSILALYTTSPTSPSGYSGTLPTGRYFAPASGPDCVQYVGTRERLCPGTTTARYITGPWYWKVDMSVVKRIAAGRTMSIEARMDLFNVFDTVNFIATSNMGPALRNWEVTGAERDGSNSQDMGGRVTSFGLRFTW